MSKISRVVENRIKVSDKVVASARTHGPKAATILAERAIAEQGPNTPATLAAYKGILSTLASSLELATATLKEAERAYTAEQADDGPVRDQREQETQVLINTMTGLRSTVETHLGASALRTYGLQGETPRVPATLLHHASNVANLLDQKPVVVTAEFGASFDSSIAATVLRQKAASLEAVLGDMDREERELESALTTRNRAVDAWVETYQGVANTLVGLYRLAGFKELADRVRPTRRTSSGDEEGPELPEEPEATG